MTGDIPLFQNKIRMRHFVNPFQDYQQTEFAVNRSYVSRLIEDYVLKIVNHKNYSDGDLYVGTSGVAYMFLKLYESKIECSSLPDALKNAQKFIRHAKSHIRNKPEDAVSLLCGNAGIFAVSAMISLNSSDHETFEKDLRGFLDGVEPSQKTVVNKHGSDEILFGRAGYLSGIYFLNQHLPNDKRISPETITNICDVMIESGVNYSRHKQLNIPMMWECYGDKYLGAAHGISAILHMILESPLFCSENLSANHQLNSKQKSVKDTLDIFLSMQSADGNFPCVLKDSNKSEHELVHWCHGAPGAVYVFAKAYLIFKETKYLDATLKCGDLIWHKGLLRKGPGLCHGVAGNGYVFLLLYRLTGDEKHLFRAMKFAEFLTNYTFLRDARAPDRPMSLYEGIAGTVCFLIDLLRPEKAEFPFMDIFEKKF